MAIKDAKERKRLERLADVLALPWAKFNAKLMTLSEADVTTVVELERRGRNRITVLLRAHARRSKLRRERERREMVRAS